MKNFVYTGCVCAFLSLLSLSCLDHRDPVDAAGSCQIVQATIKSRTSITGIPNPTGPPVEETILLDETNAGSPLPNLLPLGNVLSLYTTGTVKYRYNSQGQLIEETSASTYNPPGSNPNVTSYEYTASTLKITRLGFTDANGNPSVDSYTLNDRGLIATSNLLGGQQTYTYNSDGYLTQAISISSSGDTTRKVYTIEDGNVTKIVLSSGPNYTQTITYSYDLTKLNLPNVRTIPIGQIFVDSEANQSRNLPIKRVQDTQTSQQTESGIHNDRFIFTNYYTYTFDSQNRVKSRLFIQTYRSSISGSPLPNPTLLEAFSTDYTYSCAP